MITYAYADETEFKWDISDADSVIGSGVLITNEEISEIVIKEALTELAAYNNKTAKDLLTLKRGYFHASEDSKDAHSFLCKSINKYVSGKFRFSYYNKQKRTRFEKGRTDESVKRLTLQLASLDFFYHKLSKVVLNIETRNGFNKTEAVIWQKGIYNMLDALAYEQPSFLTFYPAMEIKAENKQNAGIQVVDFLLWAVNRAKRKKPDFTWKGRLNFKMSSEYLQEESTMSGGHYYLNDRPLVSKFYSYPFQDYDPNTVEELYQSFMTIEQTVRNLCSVGLPKVLSYFGKQLSEVDHVFTFNKPFTGRTLSQIASLYIRLFDTLPIYGQLKDDDVLMWTQLLKGKKTAGLLLRQDLIHGYRSAQEILEWREVQKRTNG